MMKTEDMHELPTHIIIDGQALSSAQVVALARHYATVTLGSESISRIQAARAVIDTLTAEDQKVYGVTTGFGHLSRVRIPHEQLQDLQHNLLRSHAAGVGEPLREEVTRAMMLLLAASLARGNSGVRTEVVQLLLDMLNASIYKRRGQYGQQISAARLRKLVSESEINTSHEDCPRVQDPYTMRCAPQVFGAVRDALDYCTNIFERELDAVTDNPLVFPED